MALSTPHMQRFLLCKFHGRSTSKTTQKNSFSTTSRGRCCSAIAIDAPSSLTELPGVRWGSIALQGLREEMEDDIIVRPDGLQGFSFAAVFDGHGGFSSVEFLRSFNTLILTVSCCLYHVCMLRCTISCLVASFVCSFYIH